MRIYVFKIKNNSVYHATLVAKGYSEVPRVDLLKKYELIMNHILFHILLLMVIHFRFLAKKVFIEIAFLYGDLEKEIYMKYPQGIEGI